MFNAPLFSAAGYGASLVAFTDIGAIDLFVSFGSPVSAVSGLVLVSASGVITELDASGLPSGSTLTIINNGYILGIGGAGGVGQAGASQEDDQFPPVQGNRSGGAGGAALKLGCNTILQQPAGHLFGGGGGGGGEGGGHGGNLYIGGSGGGGGVSGGAGGGVGNSEGSAPGTRTAGNAATAGPTAVRGAGGNGAGNGGDWGEAGQNGTTNFGGSVAGDGGAAGAAVELNGFNLTFVGLSEAQLRTANLLKGVVS